MTKQEHLIKGIIAFFVAIGLLMPVAIIQAKSYDIYVDKSHTGTEDGSEANPYNTIAEALSAASAGNTILVKNGTYVENIEIPTDVEVYGEDKSGVIIDGGDVGVTVKMNHKSKLKKVTIQGGDNGIKVPEKAGVDISKVKVKKTDKDGIVLEGSNKTRNKDKYEREIKDVTVKNNGGKGIYVKKSQVTIEDSTIEGNEEEGIDLRKDVKATLKDNDIDDNGEGNIEFKLDKAKITIKDNTIKSAGSSGIAAQSYQGTKGTISIFNNKITNNDHYGLRCVVEGRKPSGGFGASLFLNGNTFSGNDKGNYSTTCGF